MNARHASNRLTAVCLALSLLAALPSVSQGRSSSSDDPIAYERERNRARAEEERRNARRREEEAKRNISAGKSQGEATLPRIDECIRDAMDSLGAANRIGKNWVDETGREVPPEILAQGKRVTAGIARARKERSECGVALHSPTVLVADTLRRISELDFQAKALSEEADRLLQSVRNLYVADGREALRAIDERLQSAMETIAWGKKGFQDLSAKDLKAQKDLLKRKNEEELRAQKRAEWNKDASGPSELRRKSSGYREAEQRRRDAQLDVEEASKQLGDSLQSLERRHRSLVARREACGKKLSFETAKENQAEIDVLRADVETFCRETDNFADLAAPYFGKPPKKSSDPDKEEGGTADSGEYAAAEKNAAAEKKDPDPKPQTRSGSRFIHSWSPWEDSESLSKERR